MRAKYRTLCKYIFGLKKHKNICIRFHTLPGQEAQVDFGYVGMLPDGEGKKRKAWIFNMRLSYSRLDYYCVVFDQKVQTFLECHVNAFMYFGGVPKVIKIDNLKAAILDAHFYEPLQQETYKQFSEHYGFDPMPCRVAKPQEKGKVEAGVKYIQINFFAGRSFPNYKVLQEKLTTWMHNKCNRRIHGTTKKVPRDLFEAEERKALTPLPLNDFTFPMATIRKVCKDCHITVDNNYYSVPYKYVGKDVSVRQDGKTVKVCYEHEQIAIHVKGTSKGEFITNNAHYPKYKVFSHESSEYINLYKEKMAQVGQYTAKLFALILIQQPKNWYRPTTGILNLRKLYPDNIIELACKRSLLFNISSYRKIKNICESGSYNLPMDNTEEGETNEHTYN